MQRWKVTFACVTCLLVATFQFGSITTSFEHLKYLELQRLKQKYEDKVRVSGDGGKDGIRKVHKDGEISTDTEADKLKLVIQSDILLGMHTDKRIRVFRLLKRVHALKILALFSKQDQLETLAHQGLTICKSNLHLFCQREKRQRWIGSRVRRNREPSHQ